MCFAFQELIQNADDAGATEVKFLFDSRDNAFGTSSLINVGLSKFQGPALYVYNNALFKEQDWVGIESIMQGSKKKDPVAAGRFGVGFNSVYHVTGTVHYDLNTSVEHRKSTTNDGNSNESIESHDRMDNDKRNFLVIMIRGYQAKI